MARAKDVSALLPFLYPIRMTAALNIVTENALQNLVRRPQVKPAASMAQPVSLMAAAELELSASPALLSVTKPDASMELIPVQTDVAVLASVVQAALLTAMKQDALTEHTPAQTAVAELEPAVLHVLLPVMKQVANTELILAQMVAEGRVSVVRDALRQLTKPAVSMVPIPARMVVAVLVNAAQDALRKATKQVVNTGPRAARTVAEELEPVVKLNRPAHRMLIKPAANMAQKVALTGVVERVPVVNQRVTVTAVRHGLPAVKPPAGRAAHVNQDSYPNRKTEYASAGQNIHTSNVLMILFLKKIITVTAEAERKLWGKLHAPIVSNAAKNEVLL